MNGYFKNVTADDIDAIVSYIQDCIGKAIRTTCRRPVWTSNEWWINIYFYEHLQDIRRFVEEVIQGLNENAFKISLSDEVIRELSGRSLDDLTEDEIKLIDASIINSENANAKDDTQKDPLLKALDPMVHMYWNFLDRIIEYFVSKAETFEDLDDCIEACEILIKDPMFRMNILHCTISDRIIQVLDPDKKAESVRNNINECFIRGYLEYILKSN